ncbi:MAG: DNA polymerase III subunit beta [Anaerolinea sp.]|nr:DNA polymerase III subunit beta [Anaerolinea sp.]
MSQDEREKLNSLFSEYLDRFSDATVYLFGSRFHPEQKGGDLDLLVLSRQAVPHAYDLAKRLRMAIKENLGDQQVDILISPDLQANDQTPFIRLALLESVQIWP